MISPQQIETAYKKLGIKKPELLARVEQLITEADLRDSFRIKNGSGWHPIAEESAIDYMVYTANVNAPPFVRLKESPVSLDAFEKQHLFKSRFRNFIRASRPDSDSVPTAEDLRGAKYIAPVLSQDVRTIILWSWESDFGHVMHNDYHRYSTTMVREFFTVKAIAELTDGYKTLDLGSDMPAKDGFTLAATSLKRTAAKLKKSDVSADTRQAAKTLAELADFIAIRPDKNQTAQILALLAKLKA